MKPPQVLVGALLIAMLALTGCTLSPPGGTASSSPTASASASVGPPANVPLPSGSSLAQQSAPSSVLDPQQWVYTVPNTDARTLEAFFKAGLPPKGWRDYGARFKKTSAGEVASITASVDGMGLLITISPGASETPPVTPPAGGVTLLISEQPIGI